MRTSSQLDPSLDPGPGKPYFGSVEQAPAAYASEPSLGQIQPVRRYLNWIGRRIIHFVRTIQGLGAFSLITLGVIRTKFFSSSRVVHPLIRSQIHRAGVQMLPMVSFLAMALGLVVVGQTVSLLNRVGAQNYVGTVMVIVVVRELGPLVTALLVLARVGTAIVIELGTRRALGEVEALEALAIDPIHYLVVPRVIGLAVSIFALTVHLIIMAPISGYLVAFVQDVPLLPGDYLGQLAASLRWEDFALLACKTVSFGVLIAMVTSYQGLSRPLRLEEVAPVTTGAVVESVVGCILIDAIFIVIYLIM